jgi:hypothetical protein
MGAHLTLPACGKATSRGENLWLNIYERLLAYTTILNQSMFGEHMAHGLPDDKITVLWRILAGKQNTSPPSPLPYHLSALEGLDNGLDSGLVVTIYYLGRVHSSLTDNGKLGNIAEVHSVYSSWPGVVWFYYL